MMRAPQKKQLLLVEQMDRGLSVDEIAAASGKSVNAVKKRIARVRRRAREGHFAPAPLLIEQAAWTPRIYLAGFDVFRLDAAARGDYLKNLCREFGFVGIYPLDGNVPASLSPDERAQWIYRAIVEAMTCADAVMANLNDFRGPGEPDSGTAFEVGFAVALRKPVWAYRTVTGDLVDHVPSRAHPEGLVCANGFLVEDFGMSVNLMLACGSTIVEGGPAECLGAMRSSFAQD